MADKTHFTIIYLKDLIQLIWIFFTLLIFTISIFSVYQNFVFAFTLFLIIYFIILIKLFKKRKVIKKQIRIKIKYFSSY